MKPTTDGVLLLRQWLPVFAAIVICVASRAEALATLPPYFQDHVVVQGLDYPVPLAMLPDGRLLIAESKTGRIRLIVNGAIASTDPIATVDSVASAGGEQGVWGLAVDPRWPARPYIYVMYGALDSTIRITRLMLSGALNDSTSGNLHLWPGSRRDILNDVPDEYGEHNGGCLRFGPDSLLYASFGDDYAPCHTTIHSELYGAIARMDIRSLPDTPGPPNKPLMVPPGNPFANSSSINERLCFARGFRNPFRFSIDRPTGRLFVGDVGLLNFEEVNVIGTPGLNYGWPYYEGPLQYVTTECNTVAPGGLAAPAYAYDRMEYCRLPYREGCSTSIVGGIVLRNAGTSVSFPAEYDGTYLFSDYYDGFLRRLRDSLGTWVLAPPVPGQPNSRDWGRNFTEVTDYLQARDGSLYYLISASGFQPGSGEVHRITYHAAALDAPVTQAAAPKLSLRAQPSVARAGAVQLAFTLPSGEPASIQLFDIAGRYIARLALPGTERSGLARLDESRRLEPGVYRAVLVQGRERVTASVVVTR